MRDSKFDDEAVQKEEKEKIESVEQIQSKLADLNINNV